MDAAAMTERAITVLRDAGARFAYVFGSRADGSAGSESDLDVAAFFGDGDVDPVAVGLSDRVDLVVLDSASLEIAGRVAMAGRLILDDDPEARVAWEATTRRIWLDERPRVERARKDFARAARARGRS